MTPGDALRFDGEMPVENIAAMESLNMPARGFTMPTDADIAAALETVRTERRDWLRYTADGKPMSYLDDCELLARWLAENAERLFTMRELRWTENQYETSSWCSCLFGSMAMEQHPDGWSWSYCFDIGSTCGGGPYDSLADGKAKAEQWYRDRLAAALAPAFPAKEGQK